MQISQDLEKLTIELNTAIETGQSKEQLYCLQPAMQQEEIPVADANSVDWNEYSQNYQIAKTPGLAGLAVAANAIKCNMESTEPLGLKDEAGEALKNGIKT